MNAWPVFIARVRDIVMANPSVCPSVRLSVCLSVTTWYCIETNAQLHISSKTILFPPSRRDMTIFFSAVPPLQNSKGNSLSGGDKHTACMGKNLRFSTEIAVYLGNAIRDRPRLLWITNSKSQAADRSVSASMTLNDLKRRNVRVKIFWQISIINARTIWHKITECGTATQVRRSIFLWVSQVPIPGATGEASSVPNFWDLRQNGLT